jgi:hypothetical protein
MEPQFPIKRSGLWSLERILSVWRTIMTQADPTLESRDPPETAAAPHPFAETTPAPEAPAAAATGEETGILISREEFDALRQDLDQALA